MADIHHGAFLRRGYSKMTSKTNVFRPLLFPLVTIKTVEFTTLNNICHHFSNFLGPLPLPWRRHFLIVLYWNNTFFDKKLHFSGHFSTEILGYCAKNSWGHILRIRITIRIVLLQKIKMANFTY